MRACANPFVMNFFHSDIRKNQIFMHKKQILNGVGIFLLGFECIKKTKKKPQIYACIFPNPENIVISDTSFESGMSDDYAIPPDAVSESTCMDASMPSLMMRASYADSPNKKLETLEKVKITNSSL